MEMFNFDQKKLKMVEFNQELSKSIDFSIDFDFFDL